MASPQAENGHTDIAHEILEQLALAPLTGTELRIILIVFRQTYGWHRVESEISLSQFQRALNTTRWVVWDGIEKLIKKNILVRQSVLPSTPERTTHTSIYRFNKDFETWTIPERGSTLERTSTPERTGGSTLQPTNLVRQSVLPTASKAATGKALRGAKLNKENKKDILSDFSDEIDVSKDENKKKPKGKEYDYAQEKSEIIAYLNELRGIGNGFRPESKDANHITARLNEGYSVEDCKAVIRVKVNEWKGTSQSKYLRPSTLFNSEKFLGYLVQSKETNPLEKIDNLTAFAREISRKRKESKNYA